mmetsp:Transcript_23340/g.66475  ORF Transcript_23340/g.66475 Transcript_23340/m.66475 type:complete len:216 (-) Transcript_23340:829-1476(-)
MEVPLPAPPKNLRLSVPTTPACATEASRGADWFFKADDVINLWSKARRPSSPSFRDCPLLAQDQALRPDGAIGSARHQVPLAPPSACCVHSRSPPPPRIPAPSWCSQPPPRRRRRPGPAVSRGRRARPRRRPRSRSRSPHARSGKAHCLCSLHSSSPAHSCGSPSHARPNLPKAPSHPKEPLPCPRRHSSGTQVSEGCNSAGTRRRQRRCEGLPP